MVAAPALIEPLGGSMRASIELLHKCPVLTFSLQDAPHYSSLSLHQHVHQCGVFSDISPLSAHQPRTAVPGEMRKIPASNQANGTCAGDNFATSGTHLALLTNDTDGGSKRRKIT